MVSIRVCALVFFQFIAVRLKTFRLRLTWHFIRGFVAWSALYVLACRRRKSAVFSSPVFSALWQLMSRTISSTKLITSTCDCLTFRSCRQRAGGKVMRWVIILFRTRVWIWKLRSLNHLLIWCRKRAVLDIPYFRQSFWKGSNKLFFQNPLFLLVEILVKNDPKKPILLSVTTTIDFLKRIISSLLFSEQEFEAVNLIPLFELAVFYNFNENWLFFYIAFHFTMR